jgi:hypothetical protein
VRPASIVRFERLFLLSLLLSPVQAAVGWNTLAARGTPSEMIALVALSVFTLGALALLVSRGRSRPAKWVLTLLLGIGLPLFLLSLDRGTLVGITALALVQAALQTAAVALLFTRSASQWLRGEKPG